MSRFLARISRRQRARVTPEFAGAWEKPKRLLNAPVLSTEEGVSLFLRGRHDLIADHLVIVRDV